MAPGFMESTKSIIGLLVVIEWSLHPDIFDAFPAPSSFKRNNNYDNEVVKSDLSRWKISNIMANRQQKIEFWIWDNLFRSLHRKTHLLVNPLDNHAIIEGNPFGQFRKHCQRICTHQLPYKCYIIERCKRMNNSTRIKVKKFLLKWNFKIIANHHDNDNMVEVNDDLSWS